MFPNGNNNFIFATMQLAYTASLIRGDSPQSRVTSGHVIRVDYPPRYEREKPGVDDSARQLVELSPEAILVYSGDAVSLLNQAACRLLRVQSADEVLGKSLFNFIHPDFHAVFHERAHLRVSATASIPLMEQIWIRRDGTRFYAEIAATSLIYDDAPALQIVVRDISERKRNEALQLGQNRILNMLATGSPLPDILEEIAGFIDSQSSPCLSSIQILDADGVRLAGARCLPQGAPRLPIFGKEGALLGTLSLYLADAGSPCGSDVELLTICARLAGIAIEGRASEERIRFLAHYDGLTSLPNRLLFGEYLDQALSDAECRSGRFAVLFIDFDRFKEINDSFGHDAGDQVLRDVAGRLRAALRDTDKIARMGGDEFYVLIENVVHERDVEAMAQKLLHAASRPLLIGDDAFRLSVSIGIALYPKDGNDGATLLRNADHAMYRAKDRGKDGYWFYAAGDERHSGEQASPLSTR